MAFASTIEGRAPLNPPNKRENEAAALEWVWGTYTNAGGDTGGEINPECDNVLFVSVSDATGANAVRTQLDVASDGVFTITTTDGDDGRWLALCAHRKHL